MHVQNDERKNKMYATTQLLILTYGIRNSPLIHAQLSCHYLNMPVQPSSDQTMLNFLQLSFHRSTWHIAAYLKTSSQCIYQRELINSIYQKQWLLWIYYNNELNYAEGRITPGTA
jgi:hypothetical protein